MLWSPRQNSVTGTHCLPQGSYSWLHIGHSPACSGGSSAQTVIRPPQHRAVPRRQSACCSAAVHDSRCDQPLQALPVHACVMQWHHTALMMLLHVHRPVASDMERVEGLREDVDAAITQALHRCLTESSLPYRPRTVVRASQRQSPLPRTEPSFMHCKKARGSRHGARRHASCGSLSFWAACSGFSVQKPGLPHSEARSVAGQGAGHICGGRQSDPGDHRPAVRLRPPAGLHTLQGKPAAASCVVRNAHMPDARMHAAHPSALAANWSALLPHRCWLRHPMHGP